MTETDLVRARAASEQRDWARAHEFFTVAESAEPLDADDCRLASDAAWWVGRVDEAIDLGARGYRLLVDADRPREAAIAALEIAYTAFLRNDEVVGSGWMQRAVRALEREGECPERWYLSFVLDVEMLLDEDPAAAGQHARAVRDAGRRHGDRTLETLGILGEGLALVRGEEPRRGLALLDEAMVAVEADRVAPSWAGNAYCHMMSTCHELVDVTRAAAWTEHTWRWVESMSSAVLFAGMCRLHRSQLMQVRGAWDDAAHEAQRVRAELVGMSVASVAEGTYQLAEIERLRGRAVKAETLYRQAAEMGRDPQPGQALLLLGMGRVREAAAALRAALDARHGSRLAQVRLLVAQVEVAVADGDLPCATRASDQLADIAGVYGTAGLRAMADHARGSALLASATPDAVTAASQALPLLHEACRRWRGLDAPYDTARTQARIADAYDVLGDDAAATIARKAAADTFERLGAQPDLDDVLRRSGGSRPGGLTEREVEVLRLVAVGQSNRQVAQELVLSEKTIARHLSNIFGKLHVGSRTAAAAYAHEHGLVAPSRG